MDTLLFIEILLTEGVTENDTKIHPDGSITAIYIGPSKKAVPIVRSDEYIDSDVCEAILRKLGMEDLIGVLPLD